MSLWLTQLQSPLSRAQFLAILERLEADPAAAQSLRREAREARDRYFGRRVYVRGLMEISNICRRDCLYCGIRRSNKGVKRYRLDLESIKACAARAYALGMRTFVLQGGEDAYFTDERLVEIISYLRGTYPTCAITLSLGERSRESYARLRQAGADRYLLRHESANPSHYARLHPPESRLETRLECLQDLKSLGYQVGCGGMVGSPHQTLEDLAWDLEFIQNFRPHMVGWGPFLPHHATPYAQEEAGSLEQTLNILALTRLLLPQVLLPATTALATLSPQGRQLGLEAGCNVVMPNISPLEERANYLLYDHKAYLNSEAGEGIATLAKELASCGYQLDLGRGDSPLISNEEA